MEEGCWSPKTSLDAGLSPHPESPVPAGLPYHLEFQKEGASLEQGGLGTTFSFPFYPGQGPAEEGNKLDCGVWVCVFRRNWSSSPHYFLWRGEGAQPGPPAKAALSPGTRLGQRIPRIRH